MAQDNDHLHKAVETEKQRSQERANHISNAITWRIRAEDGTRYGPATLTELQSWATECRIDPGHSISSDDQHWFAAADVAALHMDWIVEFENGVIHGPFHLMAARHLIKTGVLTPDHEIRNIRTGEIRTGDSVIEK